MKRGAAGPGVYYRELIKNRKADIFRQVRNHEWRRIFRVCLCVCVFVR